MDVVPGNISCSDEEGSSLAAVLIIIIILSVIVGSVMMGMVMQNRFIQRDVDKIQARYSAEAGIFHFLSDTTLNLTAEAGSIQIQLMDSSGYATVGAKPFGGYLQITSTARAGGESKTIRALVGEKASAAFQQAVIHGDIHSALNLTGNTIIKGDITTGPSGVRQRPFKGNLFRGAVEGDVHQENKSLLPVFNNNLFRHEISYCNTLLNTAPPKAMRLDPGRVNFSRIAEGLKGNAVLYIKGDLEIFTPQFSNVELPEAITLIVTGDLTVNGNISYQPFSRFIAGKKLTVSGKLAGNQGLFYAGRELVMDGEERLSGQFLAGESIIISGASFLKYPSVVYLAGSTEQGVRKGRVEVSGNSIIEGTVMIPAPEEVIHKDESRLVIGEGSEIRGGIYNTGQTELHGKISGSVLTMQFYFYHSPTAYINWLRDVSINLEERPDNYVVPPGFAEKKNYELLTWQELPWEKNENYE